MIRRAYVLMLVVAAVMFAVALAFGQALGQPLRDPDGLLGPTLTRIPALIVAAFAIDMVPVSLWRSRGRPGRMLPEARRRLREHWTWDRAQLVVLGVVAFYGNYVAYRNIKSFLPFIREVKYDAALRSVDRLLFVGHDPGLVLHHLLGEGTVAHFLSMVYLAFLTLVPLTVGAWVLWSRNVSFGYWFITAQVLAWTMGTASYYALPTLGPAFAYPWLYAGLDNTGVSSLQGALFRGRESVLFNPLSDSIQSVAGFASLHIAITLLLALMAHYTVRSALIRWGWWVFFACTIVSTIYFGWHYIADDIAGAAIALVSVYLGGLATGQKFDRRGRSSHPTTSTQRVPVEQS